MSGCQLIEKGPQFIELATLIPFTQFLEEILEPLASKLRVKVCTHMPHAPPTMQVRPGNVNIATFLQFLTADSMPL